MTKTRARFAGLWIAAVLVVMAVGTASGGATGGRASAPRVLGGVATPTSTPTPTPGVPTPTPTPGTLPPPWTSQDVGAVSIPGSSSFAAGVFTVSGSGPDIDLTADAFQYAYQTLDGDGQIVARVVSLQNTDPWAKAGVMFRESLAADSAEVMLAVTAGNGLSFQWRPSSGALTNAMPGPAVSAPYWIRLVRSGNTFTGLSSVDGVTWDLVWTSSVPMATSILVGLAVTSHNIATLCAGDFDQVSVAAGGTLPPLLSTEDVGAVGVPGAASYWAPTYILNGSGTDIDGVSDEFRFVSTPITGDASVSVRVTGLLNTDPWAKAGLMIRDSLSPDAPHATVVVSAGNGVEFQRRLVAGGPTTMTLGPNLAAPVSLLLTRVGDTFEAWAGPDADHLTLVGSDTITMASVVQAGAVTTSHNNAVLGAATMESLVVSGVVVTPTPTSTPTQTPTPSSGTPTPTPTPNPLAPVVSSITPTSGLASGGTASTIIGANFVPGATVTIGGVAATGVDVTDGSHIAATVPALTPGTLNDVTVTNLDLLSGTLAKGWFADFLDVPQDNLFHTDVEIIVRAGITAGCGDGTIYCVTSPVTRAQMAVFLLKSEHGSTYVPPDCAGNAISFPDVPCPSLFANWIEQLSAEGITAGCGGGNYCPDAPVTRAADGRLPPEDRARIGVPAPGLRRQRDLVPRRAVPEPVRQLDRAAGGRGRHGGLRGRQLLPPGPRPEGPHGDLPLQDVPPWPAGPDGPQALRPEGRSTPGLTGRPPLRILTRPPTRGPSPPAPSRVTLRVRF